jgi:hypothetical protein
MEGQPSTERHGTLFSAHEPTGARRTGKCYEQNKAAKLQQLLLGRRLHSAESAVTVGDAWLMGWLE